MANTPRLNMPYLVAGQAQKEITHNDAMNDLDSLAQISVINRTTTTPPVSPVDGDSYIIGVGATGAWAGSDNAVASYYSGWRIKPAKQGWFAYVQAEASYYQFDGTQWTIFRPSPAIVPSHGNAFAFLGDSRLSAQFNDVGAFPSSGVHIKTNSFFFNWANAMLGQRMKTRYNGAVSGYRSDQYLASTYLNGALTSGAKWLLIWGAINDIAQSGTTGDTALTIWTRIKNAAQSALTVGMNVVLLTEPGSNSIGSSSSLKAMVNQFNEYMREYADITPGVFCFDVANLLVDPTQTNVTLKSAYSSDGTHPNAYGAYFIGQAFASFIGGFIPQMNTQIIAPWEIAANGNIQQVANPLFLTTTGGTSNTGITGATPASFISGVGGSATATISTAAEPNGFGNQVTLACSFTSAGDYVRLYQDTTLGNLSTGDVVESGAEIVINSGNTNLAGVQLHTNFGTVANPVSDLLVTSNTVALPSFTSNQNLILRSVPFTIPSGITWSDWQIRIIGSGSGSATVTIRRPWLRRRFTI